MCGIAGFSLSPNSKVKVRELSRSLLTAIEDRGYMASGYAWQVNSHMGYHKSATRGSQLKLKGLPKDARHVILHTRLATHGSITDNRNNHPVISPSENIALVHNGVIYNHNEVRLKIDGYLPDVDTSVIPAVIEQLGVESLDVLDGDAAIAWFDRKQHNTLHLARYQHSPLTMCQIEDGSFIFASTENLLWQVLIELQLMPTWMENAKELDYFTIRDGIVLSKQELPAPKYTGSAYDYGYFRHQTAGAKSNSYSKTHDIRYYDDYDWDWDWDETSYLTPATQEEFALKDIDPDAAYFIKLTEYPHATAHLLFYSEEEADVWKDELYMLCDEVDIHILDYGNVSQTTGELVSMNNNDTLF